MSEPPAQGGEWRPIADQVAANVKNFIDGVDALARGGGDETVPMLLLEGVADPPGRSAARGQP